MGIFSDVEMIIGWNSDADRLKIMRKYIPEMVPYIFLRIIEISHLNI